MYVTYQRGAKNVRPYKVDALHNSGKSSVLPVNVSLTKVQWFHQMAYGCVMVEGGKKDVQNRDFIKLSQMTCGQSNYPTSVSLIVIFEDFQRA